MGERHDFLNPGGPILTATAGSGPQALPVALPGGDPHGGGAPVASGGGRFDPLKPCPSNMPGGGSVGRQALGAGGPDGDRGGAGPAHGAARGADGSQELAAAPRAMAGQTEPRARPTSPVAVEWPAAAADFALLLTVDDFPPAPFHLNPWTRVLDTGKLLTWLRADIRRGPGGPRAFYGALQSNLVELQRFALAAGDELQNGTRNGKAGDL
jgi:hypothetical protein